MPTNVSGTQKVPKKPWGKYFAKPSGEQSGAIFSLKAFVSQMQLFCLVDCLLLAVELFAYSSIAGACLLAAWAFFASSWSFFTCNLFFFMRLSEHLNEL